MKVLFQGIVLTIYMLFSINNFGQSNGTIPYYPGEYMKYELRMGGIRLGEAEIYFQHAPDKYGSYIKASAYSVGLAKFFKDIEYTFYSYSDPSTGLPYKAGRIIKEPDFSDNNMVDYFQDYRDDSAAIYSKKTDTVIVPKNIFDILTGFFWFRTNYLDDDMSDFQTTEITTFFIDLIWSLVLRYRGTESISTVLGDQLCYKIMPKTQIGLYFRTNDDMCVWFTKKDHIPIKIQAKMKIGSLYATLVEYKPPVYKTFFF